MKTTIITACVIIVVSLAAQAQDAPLPDGAIARLGSHRFDHLGIITNLKFTPDGSAIFAQCYPETILWDVASGKVRQRFGINHIDSAVMSADGRRLVLSANGPLVHVFDATTGDKLRELKDGVSRHAVAINNGGSIVAMGAREIGLWDVDSGVELKRLTLDGTFVAALRFSPDDRFLAATHANRRDMVIFPLKEEHEPIKLDGLTGFMPCLEFSPKGDRIAGSCEAPEKGRRSFLRVWDAETGRTIWEFAGSFNVCSYSPDGRWVAAGDLGNVVILDADTGQELHRLPKGNEHIRALAFSPNGKMLATGHGKRLRLWNTESWQEIEPGIGHSEPTKTVAMAPDGHTIATGGLDRSVILWSWPEGTIRHRMDGIGSHWGVRHLAFSPDSSQLAAVALINYDGPLFVFDAGNGTLLSHFGKDRGGLTCEFVPENGKLLTGGSIGGRLELWEPATGAHLRTIGQFAKGGIESFQPVGDSNQVWWAGEYQQLGLRDLSTGNDLRLLKGAQHHSGANLILSPDGDWLAVGHQIWDLSTGEVILKGGDSPNAMSPDGRLMAWSSHKEITVWEKRTRQIIHRFDTQGRTTNQIAFSSDGSILVSSGDAGSLVWDMSGLLTTDRRTVPQLTLEPNEIEATWDLLASDDAWKGQQAAWRLAAGGLPAVQYLVQRVHPAPMPDAGKVEFFRAVLQNPDYNKRELAARKLVDLGVSLKPEEIEALRRPVPSFGAMVEIGPNKTVHYGPPPLLLPLQDRMRELRAIAALERSGVPLATEHLKALSGGDPGTSLTRESKAALARIIRRTPRLPDGESRSDLPQ